MGHRKNDNFTYALIITFYLLDVYAAEPQLKMLNIVSNELYY